jgi:hypothetical protein
MAPKETLKAMIYIEVSMLINPQAHSQDRRDRFESSISGHCAKKKKALLRNEYANGEYRVTANGSQASNTHMASPGFTLFPILRMDHQAIFRDFIDRS